MNRKLVIMFSIVCGALLTALTAVYVAYPRFKKIEKHGSPPEIVAATLPGDVNSACIIIGRIFNDWLDFDRPGRVGIYRNKFSDASPWSRFFLFRKEDARRSLFPSDEEILLDRGLDSFVERYVRIPPRTRTHDFYLYEPSGDYFWNSEYFYNGQPAKFRCSFFIHLEPSENGSTRVEIFEYQPTIWVGRYLGCSAHAILPSMLYDIRPAEATTMDRRRLLAVIQKAYNQNRGGLDGAVTAPSEMLEITGKAFRYLLLVLGQA